MTQKNLVTNTSKNPRLHWLGGGHPGLIEAQEAQGQKELVTSDVLPTEMRDQAVVKLVELGVVFGSVVEDDPIFIYCKLPEGWSKRATDHSMWSELVDDKGKVVAEIFYKAAFYDRSAFLRLA